MIAWRVNSHGTTPATMNTGYGTSPGGSCLRTKPKKSAKMNAKISGWRTTQLIPKKLCL